jgi:hypothetical protein
MLDTRVRLKLFDQLCGNKPDPAESYTIRKSIFFWSQRYSPWAAQPTMGPEKKSQRFNPEGVTLDMFCSSLSSDRTRARRIPFDRARRARQNRVFTFLMHLAVAEQTVKMYCRQHVFHYSAAHTFLPHMRPPPFERGDQGGPNHIVRFSMRALWAEESGSEPRPEEGVTLDLGGSYPRLRPEKTNFPSFGPTQTRHAPFDRARRAGQNHVFGFPMRLAVAEKTGCELPHANEGVTLDQSRELP